MKRPSHLRVQRRRWIFAPEEHTDLTYVRIGILEEAEYVGILEWWRFMAQF